jgi:hypothetical protein
MKTAKIATIVLAATLGVTTMAAPDTAAAKLRQLYWFTGAANGAPAGEPGEKTRLTVMQCANAGKRTARVLIELFAKNGTRSPLNVTIAPDEAVAMATSAPFLDGVGAVIEIGLVDAGLGSVKSNRPDVICAAQVFDEDSDYGYALPMVPVAQKTRNPKKNNK